MMNFEACKNLGGLGALLMFLGCILLFVDETLVFSIEIAGGLLIIASFYGLAKYYKNKSIFTNALFGGVIAIIGTVIISIISVVKLVPLSTDLLYQLYPNWNGDAAALQDLTPNISNFDFSVMTPLFTMLLLTLVIICIFTIVSVFFVRRSLKDLVIHSGINRFATVSSILLIGAVLSIILVGLLLIWIATLVLATAFFAMKKTDLNSLPTTDSSVSVI
ncbi:MAG: DUF996 domain-containing protein [Candidatus Bathyarchaeota archaeon]|nr:DUF996 domain-containing protein [Candidatus Termiticorpusculum sp.]